MPRRPHITLTLLGVLLFLALTYLLSSSGRSRSEIRYPTPLADHDHDDHDDVDDVAWKHAEHAADPDVPESLLRGGAIAPKLDNATAKAELGRASWRLLHTMMARFPERPAPDESAALAAFVRLFARLYPCGDCAAHFARLLARYPPQTGSRAAAAGWACFVHNQVNARLGKDEFDCGRIGDFYDCGCAEGGGDEEEEEDGEGKREGDKSGGGEEKIRKKEGDGLVEGREGVTLEVEEGLMRGG